MKNDTMKKVLVVAALAAVAFAGLVGATALTANRDTPERSGELVSFTQASNHIWAGSMVSLNTSGLAVPATDTTNEVVVGRAEVESDNTGSSYLATRTITVKRGVFRYTNGSSIADKDVGSLAYVSDDATVVHSTGSTTKVVSGQIVDVDSDGVWVDTRVKR